MLGRKIFGSSLAGGLTSGLIGLVALSALAGCSGGGEDTAPATTNITGDTTPATLPGPPADASETLVRIGDADPGDLVSLRAAGGSVVEWIDRDEGEILSLDLDDPTLAPQVIAEVTVATRGREWGLLDTIVLDDGRRFATWTQPGSGDFDNGNLVVGEIVDGVATRLVWNAGRIASVGLGGTLDHLDGRIVMSLGDNVGWADDNASRGALVSLDPDGDVEQTPITISDGYIEPRAFLVLGDEVWVWDRAAENDPDDRTVRDVERFGRADLASRGGLTRSNTEPKRFPTALVELPSDELGVCGNGDDQLRSYPIEGSDAGDRTTLGPSEAVMSCSSAVVVLDDGTIVTATTIDGTETLQVRR